MADFNITVKGYCKGESEDIANMKKRFKEIYAEHKKNELILNWEKADFDNLEFSGSFDYYKSSEADDDYNEFSALKFKRSSFDKEIINFFDTLRKTFPNVEFLFHSWSYLLGKDSGKIITFEDTLTFDDDSEENPKGYNGFIIKRGDPIYNCWDEKNGGKETLEAWHKYIKADRATWYLDNTTPQSEWEEALEKERETHAYFNIIVYKTDPRNRFSNNKKNISSEKEALELIKINPGMYLEIPMEYRTKEVCLKAAEQLGAICSFIPENLQSEDFYIELLNANRKGIKNAFRFIPVKFMTEKVCLAGIDNYSAYSWWIPPTSKTPQVCQKMIENDPSCLPLIPKELRTEEMCRITLSREWLFFDALQYVPKEYITKELCLEAIKKSGLVDETLKYIPEELHTPEIIEAAIKNGLSEKTKIEEIGKLFAKTREKILEAEAKALKRLEKFREEN